MSLDLRVDRVAGGKRNVTLHVTGILTEGDLPLTPIDLDSENKDRAKLSSIVWMIQEKLGIYLWWDKASTLLLPMESRNAARFDSPIKPPAGWDGRVWLSSYGFATPPAAKMKTFFLLLDFDI